MAKRKRRRSRRKKNKISRKNIILISLFSIALVILAYVYLPLLLELFKNPEQSSKNIENYKADLPDYSVFGIDVSHYQESIDWSKVFSEQKIDFVFLRATAGIDNSDKKFKQNWDAVKNANVIRGAYHYYRPDENSEEQANFFIQNVNLEEGDLPPVLDIEKYSRNQSLQSLKNGLLNWLEIIEAHYKITPIIYTYNKFYVSAIFDDPRFEKYPIWIAWYNVKKHPDLILKEWIFWQFTDKGIIKGIKGDVDINVFNGKIQDLDGLRLKK